MEHPEVPVLMMCKTPRLSMVKAENTDDKKYKQPLMTLMPESLFRYRFLGYDPLRSAGLPRRFHQRRLLQENILSKQFF